MPQPLLMSVHNEYTPVITIDNLFIIPDFAGKFSKKDDKMLGRGREEKFSMLHQKLSRWKTFRSPSLRATPDGGNKREPRYESLAIITYIR